MVHESTVKEDVSANFNVTNFHDWSSLLVKEVDALFITKQFKDLLCELISS